MWIGVSTFGIPNVRAKSTFGNTKARSLLELLANSFGGIG